MKINRRRFKQTQFLRFARIYVVFSLIIGLLGVLSYLRFKSVRATDFEKERKEFQTTSENVAKLPGHVLKVVPKSLSVETGAKGQFTAYLFDSNDSLIKASDDMVIRSTPEPFTNSFRTQSPDGGAAVIKKGTSSGVVEYSETKAGAYKIKIAVDTFGDVTVDLEVNPGAISTLKLSVPQDVTADLMKQGIILDVVALDQYNNAVVSGLSWTVNKNNKGERSIGSGTSINFSDPDALPCDRYVIKVIAGDKSDTKTIFIKNDCKDDVI